MARRNPNAERKRVLIKQYVTEGLTNQQIKDRISESFSTSVGSSTIADVRKKLKRSRPIHQHNLDEYNHIQSMIKALAKMMNVSGYRYIEISIEGKTAEVHLVRSQEVDRKISLNEE